MRCISILSLLILVLSAKQPTTVVEQALSKQLNSERLSRILERALRKEIHHLNVQNEADNPKNIV